MSIPRFKTTVKSFKTAVKSRLLPDTGTYKALGWTYRLGNSTYWNFRRAVMRVRKDSRFSANDLAWASFCPTHLLDAVVEHWHPLSVLDIGCGTGMAVKYLVDKGIDCIGIEGSQAAINASPVGDRIRCLNLNHPISLDRMFDVVWSHEVVEHIHPKYTEALLQTLTSHGPVVVMSAAQPGQGSGLGHFNEQPPQYWIERLERRGFSYLADVSTYFQSLPDWFAQNVMVFVNRRGVQISREMPTMQH